MTKTGRWIVGAAAAAAVVGTGLWHAGPPVSPSEQLAKLPAPEQNLLIFNAAVDLLKANYYEPALFRKPGWSEFEAAWRKKAESSRSGPWLYFNVLSNFGVQFPDSHLSFTGPASRATPGSTDPTSNAPTDPALMARFERNSALFLAGPGFDTAMLRRAGRTAHLVAEVSRGSSADLAGVTPGWAVNQWKIDMNQEGVSYQARFILLTPAMTRQMELTGLPFAAASQQQLDEFVAAHSLELAFAYEPLAPRADFETRKLANGVTYLRFDHFNDMQLIGRVLDAIDAAGPAGLVLDLRRNTGGRSLHMSRLAGRLLGGGVEIGAIRGVGSSAPLHSLKFGDDHYEGPLVVLIGPSSSSAAEITAAAMQDHERGTLIGRSTSGSVVVGNQFALPDGGTMMIPVEDFVRSGDRRIEGAGVEPDIWILPTLEDVRLGRDPVLERSLLELRK